MQTTAREIFDAFNPRGLIVERIGPDQPVHRIAAAEDCGPGDLVFVDRPEFVALVGERRPAVAVTSAALKAQFAGFGGLGVLVATDVNLAQAFIKQRYGARDYEAAGWGRVHPSAVVHESAEIHATAAVEPRAVIGRNVRVGERSRIMAGAVVEHDARIGRDTIVHPNAVIGYGCVLGDEVVIGAGSVVGSEGFGYAQDRQRRSHAIPQTGTVVLGDRVRLGANCCVDRAAYRATRIGAGTKLDNLCHVAHNVQIGEDCLMTSMFCVAGSTVIGDRLIASSPTAIIDHARICDDVVLVHRAGVAADIDRPGTYAGLPLQPWKEYARNTAVIRKLNELRQRLVALERKSD